MKIAKFEAIIFDLGGVILNIDYQKTIQAFQNLGLENFDEMYTQAIQSDLFDRFETGEISSFYFINKLKDFLPKSVSPNEIVAAWNAMLLDFPNENIAFLKEINKQIPCFLLSNTNEIHVQAFHRRLKHDFGLENFESLFRKVYYSNELGMRKPHPETFEKVCSDNKLNKQKTLFIDDSIQHIEGAKKIGLNCHHFQKDEHIYTLLELK